MNPADLTESGYDSDSRGNQDGQLFRIRQIADELASAAAWSDWRPQF